MGKTSRVSRIYLCDPFDWSEHHLEHYDVYDSLLQEIDGLRIPSALLGEAGPEVRIRLRKQNHPDTLHLIRHGKLPLRAYKDLVPIVLESDWPLDERYNKDMARAIAATLFEPFAIKIVVALSLYLPGSVRCHFAYTGGNRGPDLNMACGNELNECVQFLSKHKIPLTPQIKFIEFLDWLTKINGFWVGRPVTNLERAVCLLTHMHHYHFLGDNIEDFVWCMAAIEAIYTSSSASIMDQLKRRIGLVLPEYQHAFTKKRLDGLYSYRSRLVHGNIPVPSRFIEVTDEEAVSDRYEESFAIGTSIALKTVHRAAELRLREVAFQETFKEQ